MKKIKEMSLRARINAKEIAMFEECKYLRWEGVFKYRYISRETRHKYKCVVSMREHQGEPLRRGNGEMTSGLYLTPVRYATRRIAYKQDPRYKTRTLNGRKKYPAIIRNGVPAKELYSTCGPNMPFDIFSDHTWYHATGMKYYKDGRWQYEYADHEGNIW